MYLFKKYVNTTAAVLSLLTFTGSALALKKPTSTNTPFNFNLSPHLGEVTQHHIPAQRSVDTSRGNPETLRLKAPSRARQRSDVRLEALLPDFILIQNVHSNLSVQYAISGILKQLKEQGLLPKRVAVEGAQGPIDIKALQRDKDVRTRKKIVDYLVSQGEMSGAMIFVVLVGNGDLYGVETMDLYDTSVEMFRRSYKARTRLSKELDTLDAALTLLKEDSRQLANASILAQDIQVIKRLVDQKLVPEEIHQVMNQAIFAVDHLKKILSGKSYQDLLEPVSAAVDFYALALLRDDAFFKHSLELREQDRQNTTVLVAGGFHTAGMAQRLKQKGYSYAVITPQMKSHNKKEEYQYIERVLGYRLPVIPPRTLSDAPALTPQLEPAPHPSAINQAEIWALANALRRNLPRIRFSIPPTRDIFTAMDLPWLKPSVKNALVEERVRILETAVTTTRTQ